ncbi:sulfatase-like hydrolase/transferase [Algoriphagus halophytocola]|uniref:Sulfatase-like hydrolase/transferase n=1 Tax=Algoriphagus halophytocola TaxID=2991499 RepID=A0ABY6MD70_9BACT|nr:MULTISPECIES: sulfatase-like hydrolase/transferase [unclassified Algoriphagus]UZD21304.1 sulfatase-like hydrolase/transferase [Algoriphagus sp. TR-M5]WBL42515.1 sulfatase-like hydrolase/transferase [Algoriphagus sp. TR-M9]
MKFHYSIILGVSILMASCAKKEETSSTPSKPNILVILTDDQGTLDLNSYGSTDLATPNLDRIANSGVRFTQFYAAAPVCSPSRAGLLTGKYNFDAGLFGNVDIPDNDPQGKSGMPTEQITMAEMFQSAGYNTANIGKWHLGHSPDKLPNGQGFDYFFGHQRGCIDNYSHFFFWDGPNLHDLYQNDQEIYRPGEFFGDLMVDEVKNFTQSSADPFFIYWAINMPHYPYQGRPSWLEHYKDLPSPRREYAAFISTVDELVGNVLDHLEATGQLENTIVVFQSDHGHSTESRAYFGGGNAGPFNGAKFSMLEGGIRVPAIISWPGGNLPQGAVRNQWAGSVDWYPTLADLAEVTIPNPTEISGLSLRNVIYDNAASPHEVMHWATGFPENENKAWAVRKGPWKLLGNPRDPSQKLTFTEEDKLYLVNLEQDSTESSNLSQKHPEVVSELLQLHEDWLAPILESRLNNDGK